MSQATLAERAGVSRKWVYEFEAGKPTAELALVLKVLDALDIELSLADREPAANEPELAEAEVALAKALGRTVTHALALDSPAGSRPSAAQALERAQAQMKRELGKSARGRRIQDHE